MLSELGIGMDLEPVSGEHAEIHDIRFRHRSPPRQFSLPNS
jgi:hypothetical protein